MWPFKSHPYPRPGPIRYMDLLADLTRCAEREVDATWLHRANLIGNEAFLSAVMAAREDEIRTLRELRWTEEADAKQADLDMRKGWVAAPLTPLASRNEWSPQWVDLGTVDDA
jgi:hypothetical protein